ncbi:MAG: putative toxin-antitoxin system toxin component, PIN family [Bdellovibrionota bacterium]
MIIILDANVIIAAFASRGLCSDLFRFAVSSCKIVGSIELLEECRRTLCNKLKLPDENIKNIISYLEKEFQIIEPGVVESNACRDAEDLHVLGVAQAANAQFIITGDKDLLILKKFKTIKIYSPRQFWTYIQSASLK